MEELNIEIDPLQRKMAQLLEKEYGLSELQVKKIELLSVDQQEKMAKEYAEDNERQKTQEVRGSEEDLSQLNIYRITSRN